MRFSRMVNVLGVHTGGELNEVITGGPLQSGPPTVLSFTINAKPVTILVLKVTVP